MRTSLEMRYSLTQKTILSYGRIFTCDVRLYKIIQGKIHIHLITGERWIHAKMWPALEVRDYCLVTKLDKLIYTERIGNSYQKP